MSENGTTKDLLMRLEKCVRKDPNVYTNTHRQTQTKRQTGRHHSRRS